MTVIIVTQSEKKYSCTQDSDCTKHLNKPGSYGEILCGFLIFDLLIQKSSKTITVTMQMLLN